MRHRPMEAAKIKEVFQGKAPQQNSGKLRPLIIWLEVCQDWFLCINKINAAFSGSTRRKYESWKKNFLRSGTQRCQLSRMSSGSSWPRMDRWVLTTSQGDHYNQSGICKSFDHFPRSINISPDRPRSNEICLIMSKYQSQMSCVIRVCRLT